MTCVECKFFVQGEGRSGTCLKKPYRKHRSGQLQRRSDGTPIKFVVFWGTLACKTYFERRNENAE